MTNTAVAKRYAEALFDVAKGQNLIDAVESELKGITDVLSAHPQLGAILTSPSISIDVKKQQINNLFGGRVSQIVLNFLQLLFDARREEIIADVYSEYVRLVDAHHARIKAHVETAVPLSEDELNTLKTKLGANGKSVELTTVINPALVGGARVRVGDRVFDYTVAGQLNRFAQSLKY